MENQYSRINYAPRTDGELLDSYSRTITGVVGQVAEAVVHIQVQKPVGERADRKPGGERLPSKGEPKLAPGSGSGFIFSTDGFVVTMNHLIAHSTDILYSR